jgi:hypothetical protein
MFISFEQVSATATVKTAADLTIPANATSVELQASSQNVSYTMDNTTTPTQTAGMMLLTTAEPKMFGIDDLRRIKFVRGAGSDGNLNIHYAAGRDV